MGKVAFITPGLGENCKMECYKKISMMLQQQGFRVVEVEPVWNRRVMKDHVEELIQAIEKYPDTEKLLLGFSFGAYASFVAATTIHPEYLILCSLSPYFKEDLDKIPLSWKKYLGKRRIENFAQMSFREIAKGIKSKTYILRGEAESIRVEERTTEAIKLIEGSQEFVMPRVKHDIADPRYLEKLEEVISKI